MRRAPFLLGLGFVAIVACGGSSTTPGGDAGTPDAATDGALATDAGSCADRFFAALDKSCAGDADCTLANHDDCCGTLVVSIHVGTEASFQTAEQAFLSCETGCGARGCFHADLAEDGHSPMTLDGAVQTIVARCDAGRCSSHVQ